ncbi:zinc finger, CCHC-type containing protein [Tanacetum coccineum]
MLLMFNDYDLVKMIHCHVVKLGFCLDVYVLNALIDSSSRCGLVWVGDAKRVFQGTGEGRDMVSWITMIGGLVKANRLSDSRGLFDEMPVRDMVSWNTILDGYKVGELNDAFERIPERNVVSLGLLCLRGLTKEAVDLYERMEEGIGLMTWLLIMYKKPGIAIGRLCEMCDEKFDYYNNGMFMLNLNKVPDDSDSVYMSSSSTVVNSLLWHACLGHFFRAVVRLPDSKRKTLGEKGINYIFVGYAEHSKAYRFYVIEPNEFVSINSIIESRDAIFDENHFSSIPRPNDIIPNVQESQRDDHYDEVPSEIPKPRKGKRVRKAKSYGSDFQLYLVEGSRDHVRSQYLYCYSIEEDPRTYDEAMQSRDAAFWKEAINDEIGSIMENNTRVLSDLPPGYKPLGCKWIFKRKMKVDETIDKFKARLVIQGFRQKEGIDYFDTYAPVARITTIRLLLALAAIYNLVIHQMYVKTVFLNGDLEEEVYMKQPEGFVMPGNEHKVCKLVKLLYGLKQAPKQWHQKFDEVVLSNGFHLNQSDKYVYSKFDDSSKGVIICLYVDDMLIFGTDQNQVDKTKKFLSSRFSMKDMGEAGIFLFNREDCSPVSTPMDPVEKLKPNTGKPVDQLEYSRAIGCLMYAMTSTRPDIAYAVGRLSRFTSNPSRQHWKAITRVFKYLRGTMNYGLSYVGYPSVLEAYSDASWINHVEDSSSTSGWVFLLGGGAISWASKKQTCITGSTMESEFVALAAAGKEAEWLRNLIHEIPIWPKPIAPISI